MRGRRLLQGLRAARDPRGGATGSGERGLRRRAARVLRLRAARAGHRLTAGLGAEALARFLDHLDAVVIVVPDTLQLVEPCLRLVPPALAVGLIDNGLRDWERAALGRLFPSHRRVALPTPAGLPVAHDLVLDRLLRAAEGPLILLDHDCYVFDPTLFERLTLPPGAFAAAPGGDFIDRNPVTGLPVPRTHLLRLPLPELRALGAPHGVGAAKARRTPRALRARLGAVGFGDHNLPRGYQDHYDALTLMFALALSEGLTVSVAEADERHLVHLGGMAWYRGPVHTYIRHRALTWSSDPEVRRRAAPSLGPSRVDVERLRQRHPEAFETGLYPIFTALEARLREAGALPDAAAACG